MVLTCYVWYDTRTISGWYSNPSAMNMQDSAAAVLLRTIWILFSIPQLLQHFVVGLRSTLPAEAILYVVSSSSVKHLSVKHSSLMWSMLVHSVNHRSLELNIIVCMRFCCCGWLAECTKRFMYFPFFVQKVQCGMQKGCAESIMFFTSRQKLARIRHKLSLQLWLERGQLAHN